MQSWMPPTLVLVGAILVAIGTFWSSRRQSALSGQVIALQNQVIRFTIGSTKLTFLPESGSIDSAGAFAIAFTNLDDVPVYDAYVNIQVDIDKVRHNRQILHEDLGNIGPYELKMMKTRLAPGWYQIDLRTRAGKVTEALRFESNPGHNPDFTILSH